MGEGSICNEKVLSCLPLIPAHPHRRSVQSNTLTDGRKTRRVLTHLPREPYLSFEQVFVQAFKQG
jgi:hypothetical protein